MNYKRIWFKCFVLILLMIHFGVQYVIKEDSSNTNHIVNGSVGLKNLAWLL